MCREDKVVGNEKNKVDCSDYDKYQRISLLSIMKKVFS